MSYQVIARKWRPQKFDQVIGQKGVTQTLRNALATGRIAQAFVFAGARGVGKTTTARILARALNCEKGPTPDPCGTCDMCVEIGEGRDLDVLEIDAATHTGVDNVREVIIDGLQIRPARDRYKIFIIDEVHQLSSSSFNALLKSMEEPPPHVVFMMATTELHRIPETILSRAQVFEFRTIGTRAIIEQLRRIADAEGVDITDEALALVARAAEGSMRDAQSALDQVLAFGTGRIDAPQVSEVLGLVERDLLMDLMEVVAREEAARVFDVAGRLVESGHDMRHVCRELARLIRDLMVLQIDPDRTADPDFAVEGDPERLRALAGVFSREDLLRAFDLVARLEQDIRFATQPRYHLEMALLRWVHLRKLVPIESLIQSLEGGAPLPRTAAPAAGTRSMSVTPGARPAGASAPSARPLRPSPPPSTSAVRPPASAGAPEPPAPTGPGGLLATDVSEAALARFRDAFATELKRTHPDGPFILAPAPRLDVTPDTIVFVYKERPKTLAGRFDRARGAIEEIASRVAGRRMTVRDVDEAPDPEPGAVQKQTEKDRLKAEVMNEPVVQALLDVFPADIRDVEELDK
ncbi:MAG TPA: DNA polymerase III subunit gamma/tau [Vicinamibacterales bacterium]